MRCLFLSLMLLAAAPAFAQEGSSPYPIERGERVRITLSDRQHGASGPYYVGSVAASDVDSLSLVLRGHGGSLRALAWPEVARVERLGENRTGEALGLLVGGVVGGALGYVLGDILVEDPLGKVALVPGALVGLTAGGIVGAHVGDRWEEVPPARGGSAFRIVVPLGSAPQSAR